jgi:hypothetical protein
MCISSNGQYTHLRGRALPNRRYRGLCGSFRRRRALRRSSETCVLEPPEAGLKCDNLKRSMSTPACKELSARGRNSSRYWLIAATFLLAALALGNVRLLAGRAAPQWDAVDFFGPQFALVGDQIRAGHLVVWNPWSGAGSPDYAEPELGSISPILLATSFLFVDPQAGYVAYWMLVWAFGGIGMLLLTRHMQCPAWGGAVAAFGFVASGFYAGHAEHMSSIYSASFIPWIVWRFDAGLRQRDWWCGAQAGVLYGLSALGGYPELTILTPGFVAMWAFGRLVWPDTGAVGGNARPRPAFAAMLLTVTILLGFVVFSPAYIALIRNTRGYSDHIGPRDRQVSISSGLLPAGALSTLASPYLGTLNLPPNAVWPETDVSMTSLYAGAVALVLGVYGWRRRSGWRWWLVLMAAFFAACALGSQLPVRGWLYDFVFPTRYFRNPALFRVYVIIIIQLLAALASRDLTEVAASDADRHRLSLLSIFFAVSAAVCFLIVYRLARKATPDLGIGVVHLVMVWGGLTLLAVLWRERLLTLSRFARLMAALAFVDASLALHVSRPTLYTSATVPWWHEMNVRHNPNMVLTRAGLTRDLHGPSTLGNYPNNRNLLLKRPVFDSYITLWNRFQERMVVDPFLNQAAIGSDRLWFSASAEWRPPDDATFGRFSERVHDLSGLPVLVLHTPEQMLALSPRAALRPAPPESAAPLSGPACLPATVSGLSYLMDSMSFTYSAPSAGYLLVTDRWARDWEVTVNGQSHRVLGANFIFRAVQVQPGANHIAFRYRPGGFWPLLAVSWCTLTLAGAAQIHRLLRRGHLRT